MAWRRPRQRPLHGLAVVMEKRTLLRPLSDGYFRGSADLTRRAINVSRGTIPQCPCNSPRTSINLRHLSPYHSIRECGRVREVVETGAVSPASGPMRARIFWSMNPQPGNLARSRHDDWDRQRLIHFLGSKSNRTGSQPYLVRGHPVLFTDTDDTHMGHQGLDLTSYDAVV